VSLSPEKGVVGLFSRNKVLPLERKRKNFENSEGDNGVVVGCEWEREVRTSGVRLGWWEEQANEV
jgi:hypothetical protein